MFEVTSVVLEGLRQHGSSHDLSCVLKKVGGEITGSKLLACIELMRTSDSMNSSLGEQFVSDTQSEFFLSRSIRCLAGVTGIGSNAGCWRTILYLTLLILGHIAERRVSDETIGPAFSGRVGEKSGTDVVISAACGDAIRGANTSTKCSVLATVCMMTHMDGTHSLTSLGVQGLFRKVVQVCLADEQGRFMISEAWWGGLDERANLGVGVWAPVVAPKDVFAVAESIFGVIHFLAANGHGIRLIDGCGCV